jgi:hypothetical protein
MPLLGKRKKKKTTSCGTVNILLCFWPMKTTPLGAIRVHQHTVRKEGEWSGENGKDGAGRMTQRSRFHLRRMNFILPVWKPTKGFFFFEPWMK